MKSFVVSIALLTGIGLFAYPFFTDADSTDTAQLIAVNTARSSASSSVDMRTQRGLERLKRLGVSGAVLPPVALMEPAINPYSRAGVYLTSGRISNDFYIDEAIENLKKSGGNSVVFDVKGSRVYFDTTSPIAEKLGLEKPVEDLPAILQKLRDNDIYSIGRFIAIKDDGFTGAYPEASVRDPNTNAVLSATWVDPSNEYAQQYNMEVLCDLAAEGINEVNFDYIRFSTENYVALGVFTAQQKADKVLSFIVKARETIDRCGPTTKLGISSYAILGWNYPVNLETLGQDVIRFAPYVDVISPMAYPATFSEDGGYWNPAKHKGSRMYYLVYRTLTGYEELLGDEQKWKLRPWIQGYGVTTQNVKDQIQAVFDAGLCGFQFWNAGNNYGTVYEGMAQMQWPETCVKE